MKIENVKLFITKNNNLGLELPENYTGSMLEKFMERNKDKIEIFKLSV
jgi:hypothetical protein